MKMPAVKALTELLLLLLLDTKQVVCHVSLSYPPARLYDLDFLDSFRTSGDCGMNAGDRLTQLEAGTTVNVTWHLGYPHGGGYRIELVRGGETETLVPAGGGPEDWQDTSRFAQFHSLDLPSEPCTKCHIRLLRQATEWGRSYQFRSCSDVSLLPSDQITNNCAPNGVPAPGGGCSCDRLYTGDRCQYRTQCESDQDCNGPKGQGRCELVDAALFHSKLCVCNQGWFGEQCERANQFDGSERTWNQAVFTTEKVGGSEVHWRVSDGELEMIVEAPSRSWVGVGWRPADATKSCQAFPQNAPKPRGTDFNAMDCTDMVVGLARGARGALADFYTRDRSTPRQDSFWGGKDDLTSGSVWEDSTKTIMRFKKKISSDTADHAFQGRMHFIHAVGQSEGFYGSDQLKYHGKGQRWITVIDVPVESSSMHPIMAGLVVAVILLAFITIMQFGINLYKQCSRK